MPSDWKKRFIELSEYIASWSKDESTKVGAVITDDDNTILSVGYNGFPRNMDDNVERRKKRPEKYFYTEHAERNAIYNAGRSGMKLKGSNIYVMWFPCVGCSRAIVQVGIKQLVCPKPDFNDDKWGEEFSISYEILSECGVEVNFYKNQ